MGYRKGRCFKEINFYIIGKGGPPLLGYDFIYEFNIKIGNINYLVNHVETGQFISQYKCYLKEGAFPKHFRLVK